MARASSPLCRVFKTPVSPSLFIAAQPNHGRRNANHGEFDTDHLDLASERPDSLRAARRPPAHTAAGTLAVAARSNFAKVVG